MKSHIKNLMVSCLIGISILTTLTGCSSFLSPGSSTPLKRTEFVLGTAVTLSLYDHKDEGILTEAFNHLKSLEDILSINKTGTLLDKISDNSGISPVKVDDSTYTLIEAGLQYSTLTQGSFDITIGPIVKLWNIGFPDARVPSQEEIQASLPLIDYKKVTLDKENRTIFLQDKGMKIDLGGIAKGYAADEVARIFKEHKVQRALIDLGGNIYALGNKSKGTPWQVGVQDPFNPRGSIIGHLPIENKSIVTSGIYERYIEKDGKTYHHILNPDTGYPFDNDLAGITIISNKSIDGDALSTSVFSKGLEEGLKFVNTLENIDAIFITKDKKVYLSEGVKNSFVLTSTQFTLIK